MQRREGGKVGQMLGSCLDQHLQRHQHLAAASSVGTVRKRCFEKTDPSERMRAPLWYSERGCKCLRCSSSRVRSAMRLRIAFQPLEAHAWPAKRTDVTGAVRLFTSSSSHLLFVPSAPLSPPCCSTNRSHSIDQRVLLRLCCRDAADPHPSR